MHLLANVVEKHPFDSCLMAGVFFINHNQSNMGHVFLKQQAKGSSEKPNVGLPDLAVAGSQPPDTFPLDLRRDENCVAFSVGERKDGRHLRVADLPTLINLNVHRAYCTRFGSRRAVKPGSGLHLERRLDV